MSERKLLPAELAILRAIMLAKLEDRIDAALGILDAVQPSDGQDAAWEAVVGARRALRGDGG